MIIPRRLLCRNCLILALSLLTVYELYNFFGIVVNNKAQNDDNHVEIRSIAHNRIIFSNIEGREEKNTAKHHELSDRYSDHSPVRVINDTKFLNNPTKVFIGKDPKHYKMFVGILSAKRDPPTVVGMAEELVKQVSHREDYKFATWISHSAANEYHVINQLKELGFEVYISNGTYPELRPDKIRITHHDSLERVKWRATHVLDYANLLERSLSYDAEFVLILEDDLKPAKHALEKSYYAASEQLRAYKDWAILTLFGKQLRQATFKVVTGYTGTYGACTMLFKRDIASGIIDYFRHAALEEPVDILLPRYLEILGSGEIYERTPNLFQHISQHSSYKLQDKERRGTERGRSITFLYDEDNDTLASIPAKPDGYIGCFVDQPGPARRDLSGLYAYLTDKKKDRRPSPTLCRKYCGRYRYYGLQNGGDCYCGNEFGQYGWASENECNQPCSANKNVMCGGKYRNSVYRV